MSNTAGRQDARDATRSSLRLTKSPTEFVPSSMRNMTPQIPENAVVGQFSQQFEDVFAHQLPKTSARPAQPSVSQRPAQHSRETSGGTDERGVLDPQTGLHRVQQEPPRDTNMKEIRERHSTPPPRPGSPDDWRSSTMDEFADRMLSLQSSHPPMAPLQPMEYPRELAAVYETPEFHAQERTYYMELLHTETPESPEKARSIGIGAYGYRLLKMRDTVRRTFPNSTFPLLNGDKVGDTEVSNYPEEIQEAFYSESNPNTWNSSEDPPLIRHRSTAIAAIAVRRRHLQTPPCRSLPPSRSHEIRERPQARRHGGRTGR